METPRKDNEKLLEQSMKKLYELEYHAVSTKPDDYIVNNALTYSDKMDILNQMLAYFVDTNEYEKCAVIKDVIERVKEKHKNEL